MNVDFSTLLGPVFFLWLLQMLLPVIISSFLSGVRFHFQVNVHNLMYEKDHHLRIMMKMQGLDDRVYYFVTYLWQYFIYACFIAVFIVSGSWIGLSVLTKNQLSLQVRTLKTFDLTSFCLYSWRFMVCGVM